MHRRALLLLAGSLVLAGCGFQPRGQSPLPFSGAWVEARPTCVVAQLLRDHLAQQGKLAASKKAADVVIQLTNDLRDKTILSLSGAGKVREYRLVHTVTVAAVGPDGQLRLAPAEIKLTRDISYSDEQVLAKEAEEAMLRRDMDEDALRQILRRLAFVGRA